MTMKKSPSWMKRSSRARSKIRLPTESEPVQDPWEPFNSTTFTVNYNIDRYALKPAARVYSGPRGTRSFRIPWPMRLITWDLPHDFSIASSRGNSSGPE